MKLAEVHTIYETNARSIPDMMRQSADSIEAEKDDPDVDPTKTMLAIQLTEEGRVEVYGWGETDAIHAIGVVQLGLQKLLLTIGLDE